MPAAAPEVPVTGDERPGKRLENLVAWIESSLRERGGAQVTWNERLPDRDTQEPRQIDVAIRVTSGHDTWLGIVEVRDRNRPVDARYVEEVFGKRDSVGADVAYIVSRSGFYETARKKAERHGIRLLTLDEASEHNWSAWCGLRDFRVIDRVHDHIVVTLGRVGSDEILSVADEAVAAVLQDQHAKILTDANGMPLASFRDLGMAVVNHMIEQVYADVPMDGTVIRRTLIVHGPFGDDIHIRNAGGDIERIGAVRIDADFWHRVRSYPVTLHRYRKESVDGSASIAEVVESVLEMGDKQVRMEMLAETDGSSVGGGRALKLRTTLLVPSGPPSS
jgi:hypothetical protein